MAELDRNLIDRPNLPLKHNTRWPRIRMILACLALLSVTLIGAGVLYQSMATARDSRQYPPPGKLIDVGGHRLHLNSMGKGNPTVILDAGAGGTSLDWSFVQDELAKTTRVCTYDRAGFGWSEQGPTPRTSERIVEELHALLTNAEIEAPYVLVGHSFGGLNARLYAARYPDEVAGLVLVDSVHEDLYLRMPAGLREASHAQRSQLFLAQFLAPIGLARLFAPPLAAQDLPPEIQPAANALGFRSRVYSSLYDEGRAFDVSASQLRAARIPADLPLTVLTRTRQEQWPAGISVVKAEQVWNELQSELANLSRSSTHILVEDSGHFIQIDQPAVVIQAILQQVQDAQR